MELYKAIQADPDREYARKTVDFIISTFQTYPCESVCICYNGGKDCTVLLHLVRAALAGYGGKIKFSDVPIVYFKVC